MHNAHDTHFIEVHDNKIEEGEDTQTLYSHNCIQTQ